MKVRCGREERLYTIAVIISCGIHPFSFRTRKLSHIEPMVLYGTLYGRVGRCRISLKESERTARTFSYAFSRMRAERMRLSRLPLARAALRPPPRISGLPRFDACRERTSAGSAAYLACG